MEGKEVRFGIANSALYATVTTDASCGAVNAMHDSFTPIGGLVPMVNMQLGEVVFGGVGAGLYGMLVMVVLTVFIAGLMVGRTPEYLGKKIQAREVQMAMLYVLVFPPSILDADGGLRAGARRGLKGLNNAGPHGLSEILYAFTSTPATTAARSPGSPARPTTTTPCSALAMLIGRFAMIVPMLALAGFLAEQAVAPESAGTFPVTTPLFVVLLIGVILIVGALTFFPALALGPIVEHLSMQRREAVLTCQRPKTRPLFDPPDRPARAWANRVRSSSIRAHMLRNPVMFVVLVGSVLTTVVLHARHRSRVAARLGFTLQIALWLWFTVLFANFAEAMAEGRGKAQADTLRTTRTQTTRQAARASRRDGISIELGVVARRCGRAIWCSARRATSSRATAKSSKASRRSTSRRSPASPRRSSASPAATARRSRAGRKVLSD